jgi:hypothetical protein
MTVSSDFRLLNLTSLSICKGADLRRSVNSEFDALKKTRNLLDNHDKNELVENRNIEEDDLTNEEVNMADDDPLHSVIVDAANATEAIAVVDENIDFEAKSIELVKKGAGYTCTIKGLPDGSEDI